MFATWGVARRSRRVALPQADLFRPFGAILRVFGKSTIAGKVSRKIPELASAG
jgi:hypothetical protein